MVHLAENGNKAKEGVPSSAFDSTFTGVKSDGLLLFGTQDNCDAQAPLCGCPPLPHMCSHKRLTLESPKLLTCHVVLYYNMRQSKLWRCPQHEDLNI
jgi:hypothetical protein